MTAYITERWTGIFVTMHVRALGHLLPTSQGTSLLFLSFNTTGSVQQIGGFPLIRLFHSATNGQSIYSFGSGWAQIADPRICLSPSIGRHQTKGLQPVKNNGTPWGGQTKESPVRVWRTILMTYKQDWWISAASISTQSWHICFTSWKWVFCPKPRWKPGSKCVLAISSEQQLTLKRSIWECVSRDRGSALQVTG